jgi:hypothetical protein
MAVEVMNASVANRVRSLFIIFDFLAGLVVRTS